MADIALLTANRVEVVESIEQLTTIAAEAITPGQSVRLEVTTGKFTKANASSAAEARIYGIAVGTHSILAGMPVTAVRKGVLDGFVFTQDWDAAIFLDDTDGVLADSAGTIVLPIGRIIPGTAELLGAAMAKLLLVDIDQTDVDV